MEEIVITVKLGSCNECRHKGHSGAFTPGGAKPQCHYGKHRELEYEEIVCKTCKIAHKTDKIPIPNWCPLRCGNKY
jgi:hypothetical protein